MPNCSETKNKCGTACTEDGLNRAYYKDCKTGRVGTGTSYTEAIQSATKSRPKCANLTGAALEACKNGVPTSRKDIQGTIEGFKKIRSKVPLGSRLDTKENNWKDTEKLLGDTKPDNDSSTVNRPSDGGESNCFGIPIPCPFLAIGVGAAIVLLLALRS